MQGCYWRGVQLGHASEGHTRELVGTPSEADEAGEATVLEAAGGNRLCSGIPTLILVDYGEEVD